MKQAILHVLLVILAVVLGFTVLSGGIIALLWWLGFGGTMGISAAWSQFLILLAVLLFCALLAGWHPMLIYLHEARPSVRAARDAETERRAQAEMRRVLLLAEARQARANRQRQILLAVAEGFEAWNAQWEKDHPEEARELAAWLKETTAQDASK